MMPELEKMSEREKYEFLGEFFWKLRERECTFIETGGAFESSTHDRIIVDESLRALRQDVSSFGHIGPGRYQFLSPRETGFVLEQAKDDYPKRINRLKRELKESEEGSKLCEILIKKQKKQ
jgi:hypothetical protein